MAEGSGESWIDETSFKGAFSIYGKNMSNGDHSTKAQTRGDVLDEALRDLLCHFGAASIGDGNVNAGANTLAAMALTLANLVHPECRAIGTNDKSVSLGCSFVATGALTPSLVSDHVVDPVATRQRNLNWRIAQHTRVLALRAKFIAEDGNYSVMDVNGDRKKATRETLVEAVVAGERLARDFTPTVHELLTATGCDEEEDNRHELLSRHAFFICGESPSISRKALPNAHLDRPLVCFTLNGTGGDSGFVELVRNVLDGYSRENSMGRGNLIVLDPTETWMNGNAGKKSRVPWINRMLWLGDLPGLPGFESYCDSKSPYLHVGTSAFEFPGLHRVLTSRLLEKGTRLGFRIFGAASDGGYFLNIGNYQEEWSKILLQKEVGLPGITCALRSLPASLIAGFGAMGIDNESGYRMIVRAAYKMSVILADRMVLAHERLCHSEKRSRQEELETRVIGSLAKKGPLKAYTIAKNLNDVRTVECNEVLTTLESRGLVRMAAGNVWCLSESGVITSN